MATYFRDEKFEVKIVTRKTLYRVTCDECNKMLNVYKNHLDENVADYISVICSFQDSDYVNDSEAVVLCSKECMNDYISSSMDCYNVAFSISFGSEKVKDLFINETEATKCNTMTQNKKSYLNPEPNNYTTKRDQNTTFQNPLWQK